MGVPGSGACAARKAVVPIWSAAQGAVFFRQPVNSLVSSCLCTRFSMVFFFLSGWVSGFPVIFYKLTKI
jgi:hypothetical protein